MMTILATLAILTAQPSEDIQSYVQKNFEDATFTVKTGKHSTAELAKINRDFAQSYRVKESQVWLKEPFKMRMVSTVEDTKIIFLVVGGKKTYRAPSSNISHTEDVSKAPGKRQTIFDFGILAPSLFDSLFDAQFIRFDRATKDVVFDFTYKSNLKDSSRHRVWIDPDKKIITKREWYGQKVRTGGRLMATFVYSNPVQTKGVWMSSAVTVSNSSNKEAGNLSYQGIKMNEGMDEKLFK